jgi:hypothetical protein
MALFAPLPSVPPVRSICIPKALQPFFNGRNELWRSLKTADRNSLIESLLSNCLIIWRPTDDLLKSAGLSAMDTGQSWSSNCVGDC